MYSETALDSIDARPDDDSREHEQQPILRFSLGQTCSPHATLTWPGASPVLTELIEVFSALGLRVASHDLATRPDLSTEHRFEFCATPFPWTDKTAALISDAFAAIASGAFESDGYVKLVGSSGLPWQDVILVRAACRYLRLSGLGLTEATTTGILNDNPHFVRNFVTLFRMRFDPEVADRASRVADAEAALERHVTAASTLHEDRLLRGLVSFVFAVLRTNWFQRSHRKVAAFKLDPARISLPASVTPYREIFVHSPHVEGSHVRSGVIARGGLRWSDRKDDFRTEVLGLMKTQNVKNSVIVPMGAKGAFVVRSASVDSVTVEEAYAAFIDGMLDITDNVVDGRVVHPPQTVVYDDADPYLVVAADKGTARFSDVANAISVRRGFWLGDAFASGGSAGYDHKAMGITARGAWCSVRRHLHEIGIDPATDTFTAVGIGDMSGDVFGNGMLESDRTLLVAAFDHRHIFLDPHPDPARSYAERKRLAALARSSWADYDSQAISEGGGVWPRSCKTVALSPQVQALLGVSAPELPPHEVIKAILTAQVDLLFNGGIGTYVKATNESHTDAADPANDDVRVDASSLRCRVIGEGGNLGLTQRARIEFAVAGGKINADFIDNAAGVATSDREVNLKIAVNAGVIAGVLPASQRETLLADVTGDVAAAVLADCDRQSLAISLAEAHAPFLVSRHGRLIENLEEAVGLNRAAEALPSRTELAARVRAGTGLTRPEIAVLLAMSKNLVRDELVAAAEIEHPVLTGVLNGYFPAKVQEALGETILREHSLGREIVAVTLASELINRVGPGMIYRLEERLGASTPQIVLACTAVSTIFDIDRWWNDALSVADAPIHVRMALLRGIQELIERATSWLLTQRGSADWQDHISRHAPLVAELATALPRLSGVLERDLATLRVLSQALPLSTTAQRLNLPITVVAQTYRELGAATGLEWLVASLSERKAGDHWEAMATAVVTDELHSRWHALTREVVTHVQPDESARASVEAWRRNSPARTARIVNLITDLRQTGVVDIARGSVVSAELALAASSH